MPPPRGWRGEPDLERRERWGQVAELVIDKYQVPRHPALGTFIVRDQRLMTEGVRAGLVGLAYACPNIGYIHGAAIDSILIRPTVQLPPVLKTFQYLADSVGLRCSVSVKGVYTQEAVLKFSGLAALAATLRDPAESVVLRKFIDKTASRPGVHDEGVFLRTDSQRYLDVSSIAKIVGSHEAAIQLIDRYMVAGVVYRGFILKCILCRSTDWFNLAEIDQGFECKRCHRRQMIASHQQSRPGEPQFFYKLDQLILRGLQNDMDAPVLTMDWLRRHTRDSFLPAADMDVFEGSAAEPFMECDICCFVMKPSLSVKRRRSAG